MTDPRFTGIGMTSLRTRDRLVQRLRDQGIANLTVLDRIRNLPRHIFVDEAIASRAYEDTALPIGFGQTISQPYIVARMTEALLDGPPLKRLLEVGTGCGYQTAVLAPLVERIYSIERIAGLQTRARQRLKELDVRNVRFKVGDGSMGWRTQAPFDGIIVAAAPLVVPEELIEQLAPNGRLIVPAGPEGKQQLLRIVRLEQGVERQVLGSVSFVPLVGGVG
jgi:protein-L-isoaspartate(D-aspartate) O-methyltransferase